MLNLRTQLTCLLAVVIGWMVVPTAMADGMILPSGDVAYQGNLAESKPRITEQRAVLKFDGQEEILTIESVVQGPKGHYGWVVPLPTRPAYVKAVKPEFITGTFAQVKPPVKALPEPNTAATAIVSLFFAVMFLTAAKRYRKSRPEVRLVWFMAEAALCGWLLYAVNQPSARSAHFDAASADGQSSFAAAKEARDVRVERYGTIGSYEVSAVSGETAQPVMDWLEKHHISLPDNSKSVIDEYVRKKWCFLVAEFRKTDDRPLPPHPLKAVFATTTPVYPMQLTGTQGGPLHLELVVVSDRTAIIAPLHKSACTNDSLLVTVPRDKTVDTRVFNEWVDYRYAMAKDGAVVTYLRGDVSPSQMREDYLVKFEPYERFIAEVHDIGQARTHALWLFLVWLPAGAFVIGAVALFLERLAWHLAVAGAIATVVLAILMAFQWYSSVEKVETVERPRFPMQY